MRRVAASTRSLSGMGRMKASPSARGLSVRLTRRNSGSTHVAVECSIAAGRSVPPASCNEGPRSRPAFMQVDLDPDGRTVGLF